MGASVFPFGPIRQLDASLLEMPWARAGPEASVRGATGWLVTRGKRGGRLKTKYQEEQAKQRSWGQTGSRCVGEEVWAEEKKREREAEIWAPQVDVCHLLKEEARWGLRIQVGQMDVLEWSVLGERPLQRCCVQRAKQVIEKWDWWLTLWSSSGIHAPSGGSASCACTFQSVWETFFFLLHFLEMLLWL